MTPATETLLAQLLLAMADDELILGHRNSEWTGHGPILEEDIAFANIAIDELGHARLWYDLHGAISGATADDLVFLRDPADFRNVRLVELPRGDWAHSMLRQYLFDAFELVRADQLLATSYRPLAEVAAKVRQEERYHFRHSETWIRRLGLGTAESHSRTQTALDSMWPYVEQLFQLLLPEQDTMLAGIFPRSAELRTAWEAIVRPFLADAGLQLPEGDPVSREGRHVHTPHLAPLLQEMQEVARLNPGATW
jgi:ring-1,2-phenylacetyl-CoA epoxidase subunit PaaC